MRTVSQAFKDMIPIGGKRNDLIVTIDSVDYKPQKLKVSFKGELFKTTMTELDIEVKNIGNTIEKYVDAKFGLLIDDAYEYIEWNEFFINKCDVDEDKKLSKFKAYDKMIDFMVMYNIDSSATNVLDYVKDICSEVGVELYSESFYNSDLSITADYFVTQNVTYRDVLEQIAETTLCNIYIKDNKLYLRSIHDGEDTPELLSNYVIKKGTTNPFFGEVNTFNLGRDPQVGDDAYVSDPTMVAEDGIKELRFANNQFLDKDRVTLVQNMFPHVKGLGFYPVKVETLGLGYLEFGDWLLIPDAENNTTYKTCVTSYDFTVTTGTKDIIISETPTTSTERYKYASAVEKRMTNTEIIVDKQAGTIEALSQEIVNLTDFLKEAEGTGYLKLDNAPESTGAINRLKITGFDLRELYPDMAYPSNYTFPGVLSFYTLIFSPMPIKYAETLPTAGFDNYGQIYNEGGLSGKFWKSGASEDTQPITMGNNLSGKILHLEMPSGELSNVDGEQLIAQMTPVSSGVGAFLLYDRKNGIERIFIEQNVMPFVMELYNSDTGLFIEKLFLEDGYAAVNSVNTNAPGYDLLTWGDYAWNEYNDDKIKMVYANSPHPLLNDDELVFENNMIKVIQKNAFNFATNQWESLLQPIEYNLGAVELPTYENETYITMKYFDNVDYWAEYIEDNEFTRNYQTQVESKGQINVNSRQLVLKVDSNGHIAETELWADPKTGSRIKLKADDINLEGYTTINEGFSVDLKGNATMQNATILGSEVRLADNTEIIGGQGLYTLLKYSGEGNIGRVFTYSGVGGGFELAKNDLLLSVYIPTDFKIERAFVVLEQHQTYHGDWYTSTMQGTDTYINQYGKLTNVNLYNAISGGIKVYNGWAAKDYSLTTPITSAFNNYTAPNFERQLVVSAEIKDSLQTGLNIFVLSNGELTTEHDYSTPVQNVRNVVSRTAYATASVFVYGYAK